MEFSKFPKVAQLLPVRDKIWLHTRVVQPYIKL